MELIIISKHTFFVNSNQNIFSTGSSIEDFLQTRKIDYICIKHPINNVSSSLGEDFVANRKKYSVKTYPSSLAEYFLNGKLIKKVIPYQNSSLLLLKTWQEFFVTFKLIKRQGRIIDLFIGIDPLNALYGLILKKIGKVKKVFFYTADYAIKRFNNPIINWTYHAIDKLAIYHSDQVWNVSTRITTLRKQQGVPDNKNFFVPNSPPFKKEKILNIKNINIHEIVTVGITSSSINFDLLLRVLFTLKNKYPDIVLKIIGGFEWQDNFKVKIQTLNLQKNIKFIGKLNHNDFLKELSKSAVGLAFYTNEIPWTYFCDSMKIRDFLSCGLPVITNNIHSIADDIKKFNAGYIINFNEKKLINVIDKIFKNKTDFLKLRDKGLTMAKKYDIEEILNSRLSAYLI